jgi:hypothetical protein
LGCDQFVATFLTHKQLGKGIYENLVVDPIVVFCIIKNFQPIMDNALQRGVVVPNEIQIYNIGVHWMLLQLKLQQKMSFSTRWNNLLMGLTNLYQIVKPMTMSFHLVKNDTFCYNVMCVWKEFIDILKRVWVCAKLGFHGMTFMLFYGAYVLKVYAMVGEWLWIWLMEYSAKQRRKVLNPKKTFICNIFEKWRHVLPSNFQLK